MAITPLTIDDIFDGTAVGSLERAVGNNMFGINSEQTRSAVPSNQEQQGFTFFTRPQLNLQVDNLRNIREFYPMLANPNKDSVHQFVRCLLDPRLITGYTYGQGTFAIDNPSNNGDAKRVQQYKVPPLTGIASVNNQMAFMSILTNHVTKVSGFPDMTVPMYTSDTGRYREAIAFYDGLAKNMEQYTVDVSFRNTISDPILYLFWVWVNYGSYVFQGKMLPYMDFMVHNRIDYNSRIWRLRLDRNRYRVTKIMATGPAIPIASSVGEFADFNIDEVFSSANKEISVRFQCFGFEIFDERLVYEFNKTVWVFKMFMRDDYRNSKMVEVPRSIRQIFNHRCYPRIDPNTHVLEWWVDREYFDKRAQLYLEQLSALERKDLDATGRNRRPDVPNDDSLGNDRFLINIDEQDDREANDGGNS